ncbi:high mobility group box domain-containing protein [Rhizophagus clarus]|nr:high mobility group box domain-containing protein [Rhizophagus clarus]
MSQPRTYEEIVNSTNYKFNLSIDELLKPSRRTRRNIDLIHLNLLTPPRPQNAFMLYLRNKKADGMFKSAGSKILKQIGTMWRNETNEVKDLFYALAKLAEERHSIEYPNYNYRYSSTRLAGKRRSRRIYKL